MFTDLVRALDQGGGVGTEAAGARFLMDKYIEFRDELPKSNVGKILRRELRSAH